MAWIVAGAAVVSAWMASDSSSSATSAANTRSRTELGFQQDQYEDWLSVYGPIQDNLSEYYSGLTAEQYEVTGLEAFEQEKARSMTMLNERLAQRGISDSGLAAAAEIGIEMQSAEQRARIRQAAPGLAAQEQLSFLQVGVGLDPSQSLSNTLANQSLQAQNRAATSEAAAGQAWQSAITSIGTALDDDD